MRKFLIPVIILLIPFCLKAQNTIGKSKDEIRNIIKSNPNFKLLTGKDCDTLVFTQGMQTIFDYRDNLCVKSISILPLQYMSALIQKMTTDSYKKTNDNTWVDSSENIRVSIAVDKSKGTCSITTSSYQK